MRLCPLLPAVLLLATADAPARQPQLARALDSGVVVCESQGARWAHCPADVSRGARLWRQLSSDSPCIRAQTWGVDASGIWVSQGCRAEFLLGEAPADTATRIVRCESRNVMRTRCPGHVGRDAALLRQRSNVPCVRDDTWGVEDGRIWVARGCRADFQLDVAPGSGERGVLRCESKKGAETLCATKGATRALMREQHSHTPCIEGKTWSLTPVGLRVWAGCRADFALF